MTVREIIKFCITFITFGSFDITKTITFSIIITSHIFSTFNLFYTCFIAVAFWNSNDLVLFYLLYDYYNFEICTFWIFNIIPSRNSLITFLTSDVGFTCTYSKITTLYTLRTFSITMAC